jgi:hypothetical protein
LVVLPANSVIVPEGTRKVKFTFNVLAVGTDRLGTLMARTHINDAWTEKQFTIKAPTIKAVVVGNGGGKAGATINMRITITTVARIGGLKVALEEVGTSYLTMPIDSVTHQPGITIDGDQITKVFQITISPSAPVGTVIQGKAKLNGQEVPFTVTVQP